MFGHSAPVLCVFINWEERLDQIFGGRRVAALENVA